jgi:GDP-L-fucose synthase
MKRVVVTGGSGFTGTSLKKYKPDWTYLSSKDFDLTCHTQTSKMIKELKPDSVIHLAAKVGGIKDNAEKQVEYFEQNVLMNTNLLKCCQENKVTRVLSSLSTCAFPDKVEKYPFKEEDLFSGKPAETNLSYGFSKRILHVHSLSIRKQYNLNYSTFCPSNIYGPNDHFTEEKSHFIASLVNKVANSKDGDVLEFWGTGKPYRQHLYVEDLCKIIPKLLDNHNCEKPIIVAPTESITIKEAIEIAIKVSGKKIKYYFNGNFDGQFKKDGDNSELINKIGNFKFTPFEEGFRKTYYNFLENMR